MYVCVGWGGGLKRHKLCFALVAFFPLLKSKNPPPPPQPETTLPKSPFSNAASKAEQLYNDSKYSRELLLDFLTKANQETPNDIEILWRLSRAAYDCAERVGLAADKKKELVYFAFDVIKHALQLEQANFAVHKWYGIILSSIGDFEGTKAKIGNSYIVKSHWEKAVELNPLDATSHHLLGRCNV